MSRSTRSRRPEARPVAAGAGTPGLAGRFAAAAIAALSIAGPALAAGTEPPALVRKYVADGRLAGTGTLTWFGFHVYDAALYAAPGFDPANMPSQPFVLELTYARRLEGKGIAEASRDEIERLGFGTEAQRAGWTEQMSSLFPDVERGRRITGVNLPGVGARFYFDDRFLGGIDDPAFARAFFAIWLDPRTRAPQLRERLIKSASMRATRL